MPILLRIILIRLSGAALGFIGYRLRGSGKVLPGLGNTGQRLLFWGVPVGVMMALATGSWIFAMASVPLGWLGVIPGYWGGQFALADPANRNFKNYFILGLRGAFISLPIFLGSLVAQYFGVLDVTVGLFGIIAGALFPVYYLAGLKLQKFKLPLLTNYAEWGEALLGTAVLAVKTIGF